jgi:hypothetical protein
MNGYDDGGFHPEANVTRNQMAMIICALLGLRKEEIPAAPPYIRVLGFNRRGQAVLKDMNARASLPVFVKPAHVRRLSTEAQAVFALEDRFTDLFSLCFSNPLPCGLEWTTNPVIHPDRKI